MYPAFCKGVLMGNRIPKDYIMTTGFGDTDMGWGDNPYEVGSFDMALVMAGIENFNIVRYTSIIPPEAMEISIEKARSLYHPGAVMEAVIAQTNGCKGERICAGIGRVHVRRNYDGMHVAGYAAEYMGNENEEEARKHLHASLIAVAGRRYDLKEYTLFGEKLCVQEHIIEHKHGTVIAAVGFLSYIYPVLGML